MEVPSRRACKSPASVRADRCADNVLPLMPVCEAISATFNPSGKAETSRRNTVSRPSWARDEKILIANALSIFHKYANNGISAIAKILSPEHGAQIDAAALAKLIKMRVKKGVASRIACLAQLEQNLRGGEGFCGD